MHLKSMKIPAYAFILKGALCFIQNEPMYHCAILDK